MNATLMDNTLSGVFLLIWVITLVWYQNKNNKVDGGTAVIIMYIIYACFSILTINDPLFSTAFNPLKTFPYIYLYCMQILALAPVIYHHIHPSKTIEDPNTRVLKWLSVFIIICTIFLIPQIISEGIGGIFQIFTDATAGKDTYMEQVEAVQDSGKTIRNLPAVLFNSMSDLAIFLFFYFLTKEKKNKWIIIGLGFSIILDIVIPITNGQRGGVIIGILTVIGGYLLFRCFLSRKIQKRVRYIGIVLVIAVSLPVIAITVSRFGNETGGIGGFVNWYVGQGSLYFNNYALDAGGTRNGDRVLNYFKRVVARDVPSNFVERRDKYYNLDLDDNYFSTFVGDFCLDFGPIATVFIFIIFAWIITAFTKHNGEQITLYQLLLLYFTLCISLQGGMTLFSFADSGNLRIVTLFSLYAYLRYHETLLKKFPVLSNGQTK